MEMELDRVYSTGDRPESPLVTDLVRYIYDIRDEGLDEQGIQVWSYKHGETLTLQEYLKQCHDEIVDLSEAILELDIGE